MYILKNAITSIVRNKGRNLLIGIIILVILCATSVTLAINNSSSSLIESYKSKYETEATFAVDRKNLMGQFDPNDKEASKEDMNEIFNSTNEITISDIEEYADSKYVKSYFYTMSISVDIKDLEKAETPVPDDGKNKNFGEMSQNENSSDFTLKGYSSIDAMQEFIEGNYSITDGEISKDFDSNDCVINNELATLNDISVGDEIVIVDSEDSSKTYELTVTGIYEEKEEQNNGFNMFSNSVNTIITNSNIINEISDDNTNINVNISPTFILTSSEVVQNFDDELREKGLSEYLSLQTNLEQVESATSTISNVKTFALSFLIITLIIGTIVLLIINMINIRERKYEIGVLRTIGMKKSKVCLQFLYELLIVSIISLVIGAGIGALISVPVSNGLLKNEITASQNETENIKENFGRLGMDDSKPDNMDKDSFNKFNGVANVQAFDSIDAVVDFKVLLELLGLGLLITLISGISSMGSIQKFSPLTILKEIS